MRSVYVFFIERKSILSSSGRRGIITFRDLWVDLMLGMLDISCMYFLFYPSSFSFKLNEQQESRCQFPRFLLDRTEQRTIPPPASSSPTPAFPPRSLHPTQPARHQQLQARYSHLVNVRSLGPEPILSENPMVKEIARRCISLLEYLSRLEDLYFL
jgi:hypothetical protein